MGSIPADWLPWLGLASLAEAGLVATIVAVTLWRDRRSRAQRKGS